MTESPTLEELIALNPHIDPNELQKTRDILTGLRRNRLKKAAYGLAAPFTRRPIRVGEAGKADPRTILLRRLR